MKAMKVLGREQGVMNYPDKIPMEMLVVSQFEFNMLERSRIVKFTK